MSTTFTAASASQYSPIQSWRFDLRGERIELEVHRLDEAARDGGPVRLRCGSAVRVVVTDRAVPFAADRDALPTIARAIESCDDVREFFA
jgi:hypothetical protein